MGIVDFRKAQLLDCKWWKRLTWLLEEVEEQQCLKYVELRFSQHAASLNYLAGKQAFDHHWKQLGELSKLWAKLSFPWTSSGERADSELTRRWRRAMENMWGEQTDARIAEGLEKMKTSGPVLGATKEDPVSNQTWAR